MKINKKLKLFFIVFFLIMSSYLLFLNYVEITEAGIARNVITGEMWLQKDAGWYLTSPFVLVVKINTRPMRVAITTAGHGYNAKLVEFVLSEWRNFIKTEGFRYYWWSNRLSFNSGYDEEYRGFEDIMRGYAFGIKKYPFFRILGQY